MEDAAFEMGLDQFIHAANVVKSLNGARIGMIGNRIDFFCGTIIDESDLLQKFGIEILPMDLSKVIRLTREKAAVSRKAYLIEIEGYRRKLDISNVPEQDMINVLALWDVMVEFWTVNILSAIAVESYISLIEELDACISFAMAEVSDMGIPCVCESDIHGAISSILLEAAALNDVLSFFADLTIRHPENENGLLLWHDAFPFSLKHENCTGSLGSHWILPDFKPGMCHWKLKNGEITVVRFDGEAGKYKMFAEECRAIPGPFTQNTYIWVELENWKQFEKKVMYGPYIHHTSCI
jgi:L-fucose isomerase-like protein